jgi:membrane protease YdiL (CAAX protease family)
VVRSAPILIFLGLAFGLSWAIFFAVSIFQLPWWVVDLATLGPGLAVLAVRGPLFQEGFADSGISRLGPARAYPFAFLALPLVLVVACGLAVAGGVLQLHPNSVLEPTDPEAAEAFRLFGLLGLGLSLFVFPQVINALGEELGWRDYLFPRLLTALGPRAAILLSGLIWAAWHAPYNLLLGHNGGAAGYPLFVVYCIAFGAVLAWLRMRSGSIWPVVILHGAAKYQPWVFLSVLAPGPATAQSAPAAVIGTSLYAAAILAGAFLLLRPGRLRP